MRKSALASAQPRNRQLRALDWRRLRSRLPRSTLSRAGCCPGESVAERTSPKICEDPRFDNALFGVAHESRTRDARLSTLSPRDPVAASIHPSTDSSTHLENQRYSRLYIYVRIYKTIDRLCRGISFSTWWSYCRVDFLWIANNYGYPSFQRFETLRCNGLSFFFLPRDDINNSVFSPSYFQK